MFRYRRSYFEWKGKRRVHHLLCSPGEIRGAYRSDMVSKYGRQRFHFGVKRRMEEYA